MQRLATTAAARRQREYRQRQHAGLVVPLVRTHPLVKEALIQQGIDAGLTREKAEAEAEDRTKVAEALAAINLEWARRYLGRK